MLNKDEDFAEMVSGILVFGYEWFKDTVLAEAAKSTENPHAKADLEAKLAIVNSYFKETWNIEFFDNETSGEPRAWRAISAWPSRRSFRILPRNSERPDFNK